MQQLLGNIVSYLEYLNKECGLSTSVHFSDARLCRLPESVFSVLLPYNTHRNPYCAIVKREHWKTCMLFQQKVMRKDGGSSSFCGECHAGVYEYIHLIKEADRVVGYAAVSGFRKETPPKQEIDRDGWERHLTREEIPLQLCQAVIPPLCRMLELLFTYPMEDDRGDEYNLMLQFINDRHGQVALDELCQRFGRSKSYISHMFNDKCGMTLRHYCNELKLEYARNLLLKPTVPITEVAMDVGYNDVSYFIQLFKEKYGMTPFQYRKEQRKNETQ